MSVDLDTVLEDLGLSHHWVDFFVQQSNLIEPQPGTEPGSVLYNQHREALIYALVMAHQDRYALPNEVHRLLLKDHPQAGMLRTSYIQEKRVDLYLNPFRIPFFMWRWNLDSRQKIEGVREEGETVTLDERESIVWNLHCQLVNIRPYEQCSGKVGRVLMVNHALLVGLSPWVVTFDGRAEYLDLLRTHPSSGWATQPQEEAALHGLTVRHSPRHNTDLT